MSNVILLFVGILIVNGILASAHLTLEALPGGIVACLGILISVALMADVVRLVQWWQSDPFPDKTGTVTSPDNDPRDS